MLRVLASWVGTRCEGWCAYVSTAGAILRVFLHVFLIPIGLMLLLIADAAGALPQSELPPADAA